jgi:hypothetical protein
MWWPMCQLMLFQKNACTGFERTVRVPSSCPWSRGVLWCSAMKLMELNSQFAAETIDVAARFSEDASTRAQMVRRDARAMNAFSTCSLRR